MQPNGQRHYTLQSLHGLDWRQLGAKRRVWTCLRGRRLILISRGIVAVSRQDFCIEGCSLNHTDGSFGQLATPPKTSIKWPNMQFLSYQAGLLSQLPEISRVRLTQFTTMPSKEKDTICLREEFLGNLIRVQVALEEIHDIPMESIS